MSHTLLPVPPNAHVSTDSKLCSPSANATFTTPLCLFGPVLVLQMLGIPLESPSVPSGHHHLRLIRVPVILAHNTKSQRPGVLLSITATTLDFKSNPLSSILNLPSCSVHSSSLLIRSSNLPPQQREYSIPKKAGPPLMEEMYILYRFVAVLSSIR
jgi:hypothetical protein